MQSKSNRDFAATQSVIWVYVDHPSRWIVAAIAFIQAAGLSMGLFTDNYPDSKSYQSQLANDYFIVAWIGVMVLLGFVVTSLRPKVNGFFVRRGNQFELDSGRRVPDFMSALSFWSGWTTKPKSLFTADFTALGSECSARFFPKRHKIIGQINEIKDVTLAPAIFGPKITLHLKSGCVITIVEDVPAEELTKIYEKIQGVVMTSPATNTKP
jgi:hypothetical protein